MIRVLIVSDVRLYREGLALLLAREGRVQVVGAAAHSEEALALGPALRPDVALLDSDLRGGRALVSALHAALPATRIVALSVSEAEEDVVSCAKAGVSGYVMRDASIGDLVASIESAARGEMLCPPRTAALLVRGVARLAADRHEGPRSSLTGRELQVLRLVDEGLSNKEIAVRLCIEVATVKNHVHNILEKLQVRRRGEAAARMREIAAPSLAGVAGPRHPESARNAGLADK